MRRAAIFQNAIQPHQYGGTKIGIANLKEPTDKAFGLLPNFSHHLPHLLSCVLGLVQLRASAVQRAHSSWRSITAHRVGACALLVLCCLAVRHALLAQSQAPVELSEITEYRAFTRNWWPTTGAPPPEAYAGSRACQQCHAEKALTQRMTPMANASYRSAVSAWGAKLTATVVRNGPFLYHVVPQAHDPKRDDPKLIVSSGSRSTSGNIIWTFGAGVVGQTFVLESKDKIYDAMVTTYRGLHGGMDISPAHKQAQAGDLEGALGEYLTPRLRNRCFGCHTTASTMKGRFDPEHAIPGITCEGCHGPGLAHVVAANMNQLEDAGTLIFNPRSLNPIESVDFCGACHMTTADVVESKLFVPSNVRFPPYRLEKSLCWGVRGDQRLVCSACHDPHKPLVQEASFYDSRCLSCHSTQGGQPPHRSNFDGSNSAPKVCPTATTNCTTCHMPKYYVPEMHANFTDHFIRIVRPGEPYPVQ